MTHSGNVLVVGKIRSAGNAMREKDERCGMPFVSHRWLGGMLTNFKTIRQSIKRLENIDAMEEDGTFDRLTKKEVLGLRRERSKLERTLGGIKDMGSLPDAVFVIDVGHENIAVHEAKVLGIPVVGIVDTNCSPDNIDYVIPGNDDAMRAAQLYASGIADAILDGKDALPALPAGEDEFVELDADGRPTGQTAKRAGRKPRAGAAAKSDPSAKRQASAADEAPAEVADAAVEADLGKPDEDVTAVAAEEATAAVEPVEDAADSSTDTESKVAEPQPDDEPDAGAKSK